METLYIVGAVLLFVVIIGATPLLKKKGWFTKETILTQDQLLQLAKAIISEMEFQGKSVAEKIIAISHECVKYVEQTYKFEDNQKKREYAEDAIYEILTQMDIKIDDNRKKIIEIALEAAVNSLPATYNGKRKPKENNQDTEEFVEKLRGSFDNINLK